MNVGVSPLSAAPSARLAAGTAGTAGVGEAASADSGFSAALEDAQSPADATASPSGAVKARPSTSAKTTAALPPAVGEAPPEGAAAVADIANPAEAVGTEAAPDKTAGSENPGVPDLSQWLPGWPAAAAARVSSAPELASAERQDSEARSGTPIDLLRRERSDLAQTGVEPRRATPSAMANARPAPPLPSAATMATDAPPAPAARRAAAETPGALPLPATAASVASVAHVCSAQDPASAERQDSEAHSVTPIDLLRRERSDLAQTGAEPRPAAPSPMANARPAPPLPSAATMAADAPPAPAARRAAAETPSALPLPALHASFMPATAASIVAVATAAAPPAFEAQLAAAPGSAAFAPALATQVSWLVREGVQHARLSLNPAEMGPVTVQIALDGTQARVDFSADLAVTRAAIESSLPALAAALHESGLKLAGGGVFDGQPRPGTQSERDQNAARPERDGGPPSAGPETQGLNRAPTPVQRGLVDLVA